MHGREKKIHGCLHRSRIKIIDKIFSQLQKTRILTKFRRNSTSVFELLQFFHEPLEGGKERWRLKEKDKRLGRLTCLAFLGGGGGGRTS